jgi:hypothetical protein
MKKGLVAWQVGAFLLTTLVLLVTFNLTKSRILVLQSGERSSAWAKRVDEGIRGVLASNRQPVSVHWHYLGIERFGKEEERLEAGQLAQRAIAQFRPDVVLAVDDEAQAYVARHYVRAAASRASAAKAADPKPPLATRIVFAAIDHEPKTYGYVGAGNATGIVERLPLAALRETLATLPTLPKGKAARIAVIGPMDETGQGQMQQAKAFDWGPHTLVSTQSLPDFVSWQGAIQELDGKADVLVVLSFSGLPVSRASPRPTTMKEVAHWIETNAKPVPVGIGTSFVESGGGLAIAPSPREMGEVAMRMTLDWLRALSTGEQSVPAIVSNTHYRVAVRESALRARGISLPSIYLEAARLDQIYFP